MSFSTNPQKIILVGCGFLGKYFITRLLDGYEDFQNNNNGAKLASDGPIVTVVDIAEKGGLYSFQLLDKFANKNYIDYKWSSAGDTTKLKKEKILDNADAIVYTAAIADVPFAMRNPILTYQTNVLNTLQFMEFVLESNFNGKIIELSSESIYGHQPHDKLPIKEDALPNPANVYGSSKLAQEQIITTYAKSYGLNATVLRSATMFGPYGRINQAMPIFITQILDNRPITLDGDGSQSRDMIYVEDTAHAIELALYTKKNIKGEVINIGSGKELRFINLIHLIRHEVGLKPEDIKIQNRPFRAGEEGLRVCLDITKAKELLNYEPMIPMTGLDSSALKTTIEWIANSELKYQEDEMDNLRQNMYPLRYRKEAASRDTSGGDIQVSV